MASKDKKFLGLTVLRQPKIKKTPGRGTENYYTITGTGSKGNKREQTIPKNALQPMYPKLYKKRAGKRVKKPKTNY